MDSFVYALATMNIQEIFLYIVAVMLLAALAYTALESTKEKK